MQMRIDPAGDGSAGGSVAAPSGATLGAALVVLVLALSGCVTERQWQPGPKRVTTTVYDERGREVSAKGSTAGGGFQILGMSPRRGDADPLAAAMAQDGQEISPQERERRREAVIRNQFGTTVLIRGELVTKRYFLSGETGKIFQKLIEPQKFAAQPLTVGGTGERKSILGGMLGDSEVGISYLPDFETIGKLTAEVVITGMKDGPKVPVVGDKADTTTDLVLVSAKAPALAAFEDALNLFYSNIPQVEIEVKVVEFSTTDSLSFGTGGGAETGIAPGLLNNLSSGRLIRDITSSFPITPPAGSGITSTGLLSLGGIHNGWELDMTLEALQAQGQADILSNPRLTVRNGGTALIATYTDFPFPIAQVSVNAVASTSISFKPVGISLGIKPIIAGTETVILQIHADVSAVTGFSGTDPIATPIISKRTAITSVHVPSGKSTIIGGLRTKNVFNNETKIPILGDIPILGYLFRATTEQTSETELRFIITPWIKFGGQDVLPR